MAGLGPVSASVDESTSTVRCSLVVVLVHGDPQSALGDTVRTKALVSERAVVHRCLRATQVTVVFEGAGKLGISFAASDDAGGVQGAPIITGIGKLSPSVGQYTWPGDRAGGAPALSSQPLSPVCGAWVVEARVDLTGWQ
jgi:hypothetical protein